MQANTKHGQSKAELQSVVYERPIHTKTAKQLWHCKFTSTGVRRECFKARKQQIITDKLHLTILAQTCKNAHIEY